MTPHTDRARVHLEALASMPLQPERERGRVLSHQRWSPSASVSSPRSRRPPVCRSRLSARRRTPAATGHGSARGSLRRPTLARGTSRDPYQSGEQGQPWCTRVHTSASKCKFKCTHATEKKTKTTAKYQTHPLSTRYDTNTTNTTTFRPVTPKSQITHLSPYRPLYRAVPRTASCEPAAAGPTHA